MPVTHIVLVDWSSADPAARAAELVDLHLPRIPGVAGVARGASSSPEGLESGYDWALVVEFDSVDARDVYLTHPEHEPVSAFLGANAARILVFDVEH